MSRRTDKMTQWIHDAQRVLAPLSAFGFDTIFEDATAMIHNATGYPPYNVIRTEGETVIEVALAGLSSNEVKVYVEANVLHIAYAKAIAMTDVVHPAEARELHRLAEENGVPEKEKIEILHQGIASRSFDLALPIAQGVVIKTARMKDGLLRVSLGKTPPPEPRRNFVDITTE